jgi:2-phosphosulfolactate phosphatase
MLRCRQARRVLLGAFANLTAVVRALAYERRIELLCAGTRGAVSREDSLSAGAIVDGLQRLFSTTSISDEAALARDAWRNAAKILDDGGRLADILRDGAGGRNLMAIGLDRDIETAAEMDALCVVPELDVVDWRIRRSEPRLADSKQR